MRRRHRFEPNVSHSMTLWCICVNKLFVAKQPRISFICHRSTMMDNFFRSFFESPWPLHALPREFVRFGQHLRRKKSSSDAVISFSSHAVNLRMPSASCVCNASTESNLPYEWHRIVRTSGAMRLFNNYIRNELFYSPFETHPFLFDPIWDWKRMLGGSEHRMNEPHVKSYI